MMFSLFRGSGTLRCACPLLHCTLLSQWAQDIWGPTWTQAPNRRHYIHWTSTGYHVPPEMSLSPSTPTEYRTLHRTPAGIPAALHWNNAYITWQNTTTRNTTHHATYTQQDNTKAVAMPSAQGGRVGKNNHHHCSSVYYTSSLEPPYYPRLETTCLLLLRSCLLIILARLLSYFSLCTLLVCWNH